MKKYTYEQIKMAANYCLTTHDDSECEGCPFYDDVDACKNKISLLLDLINRQEAEKEALIAGQETLQKYLAEKEAEIEELKTDLEAIHGLRNKRIYYRKFVDEVFRKQKGKELSEPDFDYIYKLYFEQEAEIERLKGELAVSQTGYVSMEGHAWLLQKQLKTAKSEAIKEFAERLKARTTTIFWRVNEDTREITHPFVDVNEIDNLVEEMVGEGE